MKAKANPIQKHDRPCCAPEKPITDSQTALISRNIRIGNRRTSVRLEKEMWEALKEVALLEGCSIHDLCTAVHQTRESDISFTAALRVFLMSYYRTAALTNHQINIVQKKIRLLNGNGHAKDIFPEKESYSSQRNG